MSSRFDAVVRGGLSLAMLLPAIMAPFVLWDFFSLPKAIFLQLIFVLTAAAWLAKTVVCGRLTVGRPAVHPSIILFVSVLLLTTAMSSSPTVSLFGNYLRYEGLLAWLAYIFIFIAAVSHVGKAEVEKWLKAGVLVALPITLYALAQFLGLDFLALSSEADLSRSFSTLGNPVYLGAYLVMVIPLALALALSAKSRWKYMYGAVLILSGLALILSYTRGAWLGAAFGGAVFFIVGAGEFDRKRWFAILGLSGVILAIAVVLLMAKPDKAYIFPRLASSFDLSAGSVGSRLDLWRTSVSLVRRRPFLGWSLETFGDVSWPYRPDALSRPALADRPHSQLLYLAASLGLIGLMAYVWLLATIVKKIWQGARENKDAGDRFLAAGILAASLGHIVQEQFSFSQVETAPLFWLLMGLGVVLGLREPAFKQYDFRRRPVALGAVAVTLFIGLAGLGILNLRFLAADYQYAGHLSGREGAGANISSAVALNPYQNTYRQALGAYLYELGRMSNDTTLLARAAAEFEKALLVNARDKVIAINLAKTYALMAESDDFYRGKAIEAYRRVMGIDPLYTAGRRSLAILFISEGQNGSALVHLRKWLSVEPDNGEALFYMATALDDQGKSARATEYYRRAAQTDTTFAKEAARRLSDK